MFFPSIFIVSLLVLRKSEGVSKLCESFDYSGIEKLPEVMPAKIETSRNFKLVEPSRRKDERSLEEEDEDEEKHDAEDKKTSEEKEWSENGGNGEAGNEADKKELKPLADREFSEGPKVWDQWGKWSSCTVSCGVGKLKRWRYCVTGGCSPGEKEAQFKTCTFPACR